MLRQPSGTFNPFQRIYLLLRLRNIAIETSKSAGAVSNVQGLVKTHFFPWLDWIEQLTSNQLFGAAIPLKIGSFHSISPVFLHIAKAQFFRHSFCHG
jgi:hypothetical protein